jgi:hypothetical protein
MSESEVGAGEAGGPPTFDEAVRGAVAGLGERLQQFQTLYETLPGAAYTEEEWSQIEATARDLEEMVSRGEDAYAAAAFDGHAWYNVVEQLQRVTSRLSDAVGLMESVRARWRPEP